MILDEYGYSQNSSPSLDLELQKYLQKNNVKITVITHNFSTLLKY